MVFALGCALGADVRCCAAAAARAGRASQRRNAYTSLRSRSDFSRVYRTGRRTRVGGVTVIVAQGRPGQSRLGVVAGRAVGGAVDRNRARRRLREAAALVGLRSDRDCVLVATPAVNEVRFGELVGWVEAGLDACEEELE